MLLPNLNNYRADFIVKGITLPLLAVNAPQTGLLKVLPKPPAGKAGWPWKEETEPLSYRSKINWPKITIVTPSYNQGDFLEQTIRSVLLQNYPNLEYIIIDGGSSDGSKQIIEKYAPWISYWQSQKDKGQGNAINMGFSLSSGDYQGWINSDDYYQPNVFHKVINTFLRYKIEFVYGYAYNFKVKEATFELNKVLPLLDYFIKIPSLAQPSCFWSAKIHKPIWEELHCSLDYELWLRLVKGRSRKMIKEALSVANIHDDAKTSDPKMKVKWEEDHQRIWAEDAHGRVYEWNRIVFLNKVRIKLYNLFSL